MTFEEIKDKTTMEFKRPLDLEETEGLLKYIVEKMPANIQITTKRFKSFRYYKEGVSEDEGPLEMIANIHSFKTHVVNTFQSTPYDKDTSLISSVDFEIASDWGLSDYGPEDREFLNQFRGLVDKYFEENPKED